MRKFLTSIGMVSTLLVALYSAPNVITLVSPALAACSDSAEAGVNWVGCRKRNIIMSDFDFQGSDFTRADLSSSDLRGSKFDNSTFFKANLVRASLKNASAPNANFTNVVASRTDFSSANLRNANFSKAETNRVDFTNSDLSGADLSKAEFARAVFTGADLSNVSFDYSNLARSDFREATFDAPPSMQNAFLFQTRIEGLDLSKVQGLEGWQIQLACGDDKTKLPDGMTRPATWPCQDIDDDL